jgi:hypothetical protein
MRERVKAEVYLLTLIIGLASTPIVSCEGPGGQDERRGTSTLARTNLPEQIMNVLRERNPEIAQVQILAISGIPWSTSRLAGLARGSTGEEFRGSFEDELFCVFVADSTLTSVLKVLEIQATPRWNDHGVHFERPDIDSLIVVGKAISGNGEETRKSYNWLD